MRVRLAILFWFYKDAAVCENHLQILRMLNPEVPVYGLYGGPLDRVGEFAQLDLDDFWVYEGPLSGADAWRRGEMIIHRWHERRGRLLHWDSLFVAQWDLLMTRPIEQLIPIQRDELVLSSLRPIHEVEKWWMWTRNENRSEYADFLTHVKQTQNYRGEAWCCLFIIALFPRGFLDRFIAVPRPELGFLEYKLPTYARAFGLAVADAGLPCWWAADPTTKHAPASARLLNAVSSDVKLRVIVRHQSAGAFHPYRRTFPRNRREMGSAIVAEMLRDTSAAGGAVMRRLAQARGRIVGR